MPRLTPQHWKILDKAYRSLGFEIVRETDDHLVYWKKNINMLRPIILPKKKEVGLDIIHNNLRTGQISRQDLLKYL